MEIGRNVAKKAAAVARRKVRSSEDEDFGQEELLVKKVPPKIPKKPQKVQEEPAKIPQKQETQKQILKKQQKVREERNTTKNELPTKSQNESKQTKMSKQNVQHESEKSQGKQTVAMKHIDQSVQNTVTQHEKKAKESR